MTMPNLEVPETVRRLAEECERAITLSAGLDARNIIARAIQSGVEADRHGRDDGLREALRSCLEVIDDYLAYDHDGDPWKEDARLMREMEIDDFARDGRLERARAALSAHAPASDDVLLDDAKAALSTAQADADARVKAAVEAERRRCVSALEAYGNKRLADATTSFETEVGHAVLGAAGAIRARADTEEPGHDCA